MFLDSNQEGARLSIATGRPVRVRAEKFSDVTKFTFDSACYSRIGTKGFSSRIITPPLK